MIRSVIYSAYYISEIMDKEPMSIRDTFLSRLGDSYIFLFIISLIAAILIFNFFIKVPNVGIVTIDGPIMDETTKDVIITMLRYARYDDSIKAVVLEINCPGGEVTKIEEIYLEVLRLRSEKPVVASIDEIGVSGGYYIAAASNSIFAKPSSQVGNIGVISVLPEKVALDEDHISTGPYKTRGASRKYYASQVEMMKECFLMAVMSQRNDSLTIDKEHLSKAEIYIGVEGLMYGLIDEIGSKSDAIEKAASYAGIANYGLVDINRETAARLNGNPSFAHLGANQSTNTVPINYYLCIEPR
jgi:protease-4